VLFKFPILTLQNLSKYRITNSLNGLLGFGLLHRSVIKALTTGQFAINCINKLALRPKYNSPFQDYLSVANRMRCQPTHNYFIFLLLLILKEACNATRGFRACFDVLSWTVVCEVDFLSHVSRMSMNILCPAICLLVCLPFVIVSVC